MRASALALVALLPTAVLAQPKAPALVGATEAFKATTASGFIDDVIAVDDKRIAYVVADTSTKSELHVVTLADKTEKIVDLAAVTLHPTAIALLGARAFVVGTLDDGRQMAALVELDANDKVKPAKPAGTVVYKLDAAANITIVTRDGKQRVVVHRATVSADKKTTRHEVDIDAIETGKRLQAGALELDANNVNAKLELRLNHWSGDFTQATGIKSGSWDKKSDSKQPDQEATYDLVANKIVATTKITDLFEKTRRFQALSEQNKYAFIRYAWDNSGIQVWSNSKPRAIELDQPLLQYDPKSLQGIVGADGSAWMILKVDPVNAEAVARKKADPEYVDIFKVGPTETKAIRKARVLSSAGGRFRFGLANGTDRFWLVERNAGFERGGKTLSVYSTP